MSKSILVINTPRSCSDCIARSLSDDCAVIYKSVAEHRYNKSKPNWCPLKEIPKYENDHCNSDNYEIYDRGWNDCIDKILK